MTAIGELLPRFYADVPSDIRRRRIMGQQNRELRMAVIIVLVTSLSYAGCRRASESSSEELKPRTSAVLVGEMAPSFTLEDQRNQKVTLSSARGTIPIVLVFYRGYW